MRVVMKYVQYPGVSLIANRTLDATSTATASRQSSYSNVLYEVSQLINRGQIGGSRRISAPPPQLSDPPPVIWDPPP